MGGDGAATARQQSQGRRLWRATPEWRWRWHRAARRRPRAPRVVDLVALGMEMTPGCTLAALRPRGRPLGGIGDGAGLHAGSRAVEAVHLVAAEMDMASGCTTAAMRPRVRRLGGGAGSRVPSRTSSQARLVVVETASATPTSPVGACRRSGHGAGLYAGSLAVEMKRASAIGLRGRRLGAGLPAGSR